MKTKDPASLKASASKPKRKMPKFLKIVICLVILILILLGIYYWLNQAGYLKTLKLVWQMQSQANADQSVLANLNKILLLPGGVTPTMAVITDIDALKKQQATFFANAKNGDRLIIYPDIAIIYDAKANRIIKVGPVQINQTQAQPVNFAIYDSVSTDTNGALMAAMEKKITSTYSNAVVTQKTKAAKPDYPQTLVVDLAGNNPNIQQIATALGAKVSTLPGGEKKPDNAAVLVIIGKQ